eukprot:13246760-Alexandrium_andersonii.AAC.1
MGAWQTREGVCPARELRGDPLPKGACLLPPFDCLTTPDDSRESGRACDHRAPPEFRDLAA